jgi:hypothetical protein
MAQPVVQSPVLANALALPATTAINSQTLPIRHGNRPYSSITWGKRYANFVLSRNLAAATAPGTPASFGLFGCEQTYPDSGSGVDANGRILPGVDPGLAPLNLSGVTFAGSYTQTIKVSGGAGTALGPVLVYNPGSGYDPANPPAVTFSGAGAAAGTAIVGYDGRIAGVLLTNAGTWSSTATVTVPAPTYGVQAVLAATQGQATVITTLIPFAAHAPTTSGGAAWFLIWRGRMITASASLLGATQGQPTAAILGQMGLNADQHAIGLNTAPGFTVASATSADGITAIAQLTLGVGIPNGDTVQVFRGYVRQLIASTTINGYQRNGIKLPGVLWLGNTVAGATETSIISAVIEPAVIG